MHSELGCCDNIFGSAIIRHLNDSTTLFPTIISSVGDYSTLLRVEGDPTATNWGVEIKGKNFAFPITIAMNEAMANAASARTSFEFDAAPQGSPYSLYARLANPMANSCIIS